MNNSEKKLSEKELKLIEETEAFMDEVYSDPEVADAEPSPDLRDKVFAEIRAREAAKKDEFCAEEKVKETDSKVEKLEVEEAKAEKLGAEEKEPEKLTAEEKELIYLGRIYKKRRKLYRVLVVAAVLVIAMAFGITSVGGPEKVFEMVKYALTGHEQINVDSRNGDVIPVTTMSEEEAYLQIEETFGFSAVELYYLPDKVEFIEADLGEEAQYINLVYGREDEAKIAYLIRPNYRVSSFGKDVEDEFLEEYIEKNEYATIYIRKYLVEGNEERWSVQFEYQDVLYCMTIMDTTKNEVEKIVKNLYFS